MIVLKMSDECSVVRPTHTACRLKALLSAMKKKTGESQLLLSIAQDAQASVSTVLCHEEDDRPIQEISSDDQEGSSDSSWPSSVDEQDEPMSDTCSSQGSDQEEKTGDKTLNKVHEVVCDNQFHEPKKEDFTCSDNNLNEMPCDSSFKEVGYDDDMLKDYYEVESHYLKAKVSPSAVSGMSPCLMDEYSYDSDNQVLGQQVCTMSSTFDTDEERNEVYDKWLCDLVTWERNRLMWLDKVGLMEGFDSFQDKDRTFLVRVNREQSNTKSVASETLLPSVKKKQQEDPEDPLDSDYWEAWYQLERLQRLMFLEDLSLSTNDDGEKQSEDVKVVQEESLDSEDLGSRTLQSQDNVEEIADLDFEVPDDVVLVYQFTDRNLWRRYHGCFKRGKFFG